MIAFTRTKDPTTDAELATGNATGAPASRLRKLSWYANRLRSMSAAEIAHRLHERFCREISERGSTAWADFDQGDGPLPALPRVPLDGDVATLVLPQLESTADRVASGQIELLGQRWPARRTAADWHLDPVTGRHWPASVYCFKVQFRHDRSMGDAKYLWELNRLQYLQPIAALAKLRRDAKLQEFCLTEISSWMEGNRPFNGLSWATGVEVALRMVSLLTVFSFIDHDTIAPEMRVKMRACLAAHGNWLARFPSRFSSANNHLIAEAAALFVLGTLWPDLPQAREYADYGRRTLVEEVTRQILNDGVGAEQTPSYTAFVLEWYLLALWIAEKFGKPFPASVHARLKRAGEHLRWITDAGGNQPRIGDDDEGRVIVSEGYEGDYVSSVLSCLSAFLGRPDIAPPLPRPGLRNLFFGYPETAGRAPKGVRRFDAGGYTVARKIIGDRNVMLVLDHGPLGFLSIAAHGHADALSLWLHIDDQPVLVDAGTYLYHTGGSWRDALRGTPAHNTLTLDFANSSTIAGPFNWSHKATTWALSGTHPEGPCFAAGAHDGYRRHFGVAHERHVAHCENGFTVHDTLTGTLTASPQVEIAYLLHPDLEARIDGDRVIVSRNGGPIFSVCGPRLNVQIHAGETNPSRGWYSPRFGEKMPAAQIVFRVAAVEHREFVTKLVLL